MITHLESYILEWEVKWVLRSITTNKASGTNGISGELFKILKDAVLDMPANLENSGLEKVSFPSNPKEEQCQVFKIPHNVQTTVQLHSFHILPR